MGSLCCSTIQSPLWERSADRRVRRDPYDDRFSLIKTARSPRDEQTQPHGSGYFVASDDVVTIDDVRRNAVARCFLSRSLTAGLQIRGRGICVVVWYSDHNQRQALHGCEIQETRPWLMPPSPMWLLPTTRSSASRAPSRMPVNHTESCRQDARWVR